MPRVSTLAMLTLYFVVFVDFLQLTLVFPLLPGIVEGFGYGVFPALGMHQFLPHSHGQNLSRPARQA